MIREGRYAEATTLLGRARRNTDVQLIALLAETFAAEADLRRGVGAKARRSLERVREAADAGGAAAPQWLARRLLAKLALEENRTGAAIALLRESVAILERMAGGLDPENEGLRFLRERSEPYAELAAALAGAPGERENHDRVAQVLAVVEKAHARALRRFRSGPPEPLAPEVTLGRIEQGLQPGELLLDYLIGEDRGVVVAIRRGRVRAAPISGWRELRQPLMRYREHLARAPSDEAAGKPDARALQDGLRVGELVLGPVRDLIAGARRVYFVPDRELAILPPAAIPLVEESAAEPRARYLGERVETAILPMAGVPPSWKDSRLPMLLAGDPIGDRTGEFPAIRYAPRELSRIAGVWAPADVVQLIGEDFSRGALIAQPLDRFRTIHFATHAVASTQDPGRCAVIVSGGAKLGFDEIARLRLGSSLVVLSACRTGEGEVVPGEGVIGLSWSFLRAGARGIAASLWRAEDATTAKLMVAFHRGLKKGQDPVEAMVRAQREIVAERPHPGSWAPFVVVLRVEPGNSDEAKGP
jgi:CHAT domain-containing protein